MGVLRNLAEAIEGKPLQETTKPVFYISKPPVSVERIAEQLSKAYVIEERQVVQDMGEPHPASFLSLENAYLGVPLVKGAVDKKVDFIVGRGFYIESESKEAKEFINDWMNRNNFSLFLRPFIRDAIVFGCAFAEPLWARTPEGKAAITELKVISPKFMFVRRNQQNGALLGYTLYVQGVGRQKVFFNPSEIVYFALNKIGDGAYGTSDITSLMGTKKVSPLLQKLELEEIVKTLLKRKANAPIHVKLGSDQYPAAQPDIDAFGSDLQSMHELTEWVTGHTAEMSVLSFEGKVMDLTKHLDRYDLQLLYGLQVPEVLMGRGSIPEGLAAVQLEAFERSCQSIQEQVEKVIEQDIFAVLLEANGFNPIEDHVEFYWGSASPENEVEEVDKYVKLMQLFNLDPKLKVELEKKIAALLEIENYEPTPLEARPQAQPPPSPFGQKPFGQPEQPEEIFEFFEANEVRPLKYGFYAVREQDGAKFNILPSVLDFLKAYAFGNITDLSDEDKQTLKRILVKGIEPGASDPQITKAIAKKLGLDDAKAEAIARTEVARAENEGALDAYQQNEEVDRVQFLTAEDELVDEAVCAPLNNRVWEKDDPSILVPPSDTHPNCRCTLTGIVIGD